LSADGGRAATTLWARSFVTALADAGLRELALAPGSRSTPLVMAFAREERIRCRVHLDERSCGFFALGVGKASRTPAAVLTTSGTAVANLYPAIVEAAKAEVPLIALTADRPHHLRDSDANQAIDQIRPFGRYPLASWEAAPPGSDPAALRHLRALAHRAVAEAKGAPAGPVHVNFPFDKPLEPAEEADPRRGVETVLSGPPPLRVERGRRALSSETLTELREMVEARARGVIIAGPASDPKRLGPRLRAFARSSGYPLLADPLSGGRYGGDAAQAVAAYDLFLRDPQVAASLEPEIVIRVGPSPTSSALLDWIDRHRDVHQVVIDGGASWKDHLASASHYLVADPAGVLAELAGSGGEPKNRARTDPFWREAWFTAETAARSALAENRSEPHEGYIAAQLVDAMPTGSSLVVSSSMPVRDLDAFGGARSEPLAVYGNRGASGIDGVVSTAFGVSAATVGPTLCLIGDVAFLHDRNGLLWSGDGIPVIFVLADNDGCGIFHALPIADREPEFTRFFATPHGSDLSDAGATHGAATTTVEIAEVGRAAAEALEAGKTTIVRVKLDRSRDHRLRGDSAKAVSQRVTAALAACRLRPPKTT